MSTIQEMLADLTASKQKRAVVQHLIEHLDTNFRPIAGGEPKSRLLTDDKVPVPATIFELVISELLLKYDGELETRVTSILSSSISGPAPEAVEEKTKKKSSTKGEIKS